MKTFREYLISEFVYSNSSLPKFKDAKSAYEHVIKQNRGRQEEIEPYIRDSRFAKLYARDVLQGSWPEIKPETDPIGNYKYRDQGGLPYYATMKL